jgi:hypothetical protein
VQWLLTPQNSVVAPGGEAVQAGANLAAYEMGPASVNLNNYLAYKADRAAVKNRIKRLLLFSESN